tara:strand:+ start:1274 stop:1564 length:291 start_codon:yes stop_codon:yes gene_type:complete
VFEVTQRNTSSNYSSTIQDVNDRNEKYYSKISILISQVKVDDELKTILFSLSSCQLLLLYQKLAAYTAFRKLSDLFSKAEISPTREGSAWFDFEKS